MFYVIYRWVVCLYFGGWLFAFVSNASNMFLIYLTNWSYVMLNVHFLYSALSTTIDYFKTYLCCRHHYNELSFERDAEEFEIVAPKGCFNSQYNSIKWYHMIQWVLFTISTQAAVSVVLLYWTVLYRTGGDVSVYDGHYHLGNGIVGIVDLCVSGLPVRLLHFYMIEIYAAGYMSFTGIYYGAGGTGYNGTSYIYPPLNYAENPGYAVGLFVGVLIVLPFLHLLFYALYVARFWLVYLLYGRPRQPLGVSPVPQQEYDNETTTDMGSTDFTSY